MGPFHQYPYEEESVNDKNCSQNISTTTSDNTVTMEKIEQMFQKMFQDNNSKSNGINNNRYQFIEQGHNVNGIPIT